METFKYSKRSIFKFFLFHVTYILFSIFNAIFLHIYVYTISEYLEMESDVENAAGAKVENVGDIELDKLRLIFYNHQINCEL